MSVVDLTASDNPDLWSNATSEEAFDQLNELGDQLREMIPLTVRNGDSFDDTERDVWQRVRKIGHQAMQLFVSLQGEGDLGETVATDEGKTLRRSVETVTTRIRSIFGEHAFQQYTYGAGRNKRIELRPIIARFAGAGR